MDAREYEPVTLVVDDRRAEAEAPAHVTEGVVADHGHVAQRLTEVGAQGGEVTGADGTLGLQPGESGAQVALLGEDCDE